MPIPDLETLLGSLRVTRREGLFAIVELNAPPVGLEIHASIREREGMSYVISCDDAASLGLEPSFRAAWLTLDVESALGSVGLTASVSGALSAAGISCNVLAGLHHDHLLVPVDDAARALDVLDELAAAHRTS